MIYEGNFSCWADVISEFRIELPESDVVPLFAVYDTPSYEGYATVVYIKDGKIYHVSGSHCSCYGLEEQWNPEEVDFEFLRHISTKGSWMMHNYADRIEKIISILEKIGIDNNMPPNELALAVRLAL